MKKVFFLLFLIVAFFSATTIYANDIDDILRNLESPEVDYHIDREIKTIVVPQNYTVSSPSQKLSPIKIKVDQVSLNKQNHNRASIASATQKNQAEKPNHTTETTQATKSAKTLDIAKIPNTIINNNPKVPSNYAKPADLPPKKQTAQVSNQNTNIPLNNQKEKPLKIAKLFNFFINLPFIKTWQEGIKNNMSFSLAIAEKAINDYASESLKTQHPSDSENNNSKEEQESENDEDDENDENDEDDEDDNEEEEEEIDYSKYKEIFAKAEELRAEEKWTEIKELFEENEEASQAPVAQKFLLQAELKESDPNIILLRNLANNVISEDPNNQEANYALALYYYKNKKQNIKQAKKHIELAMKSSKPSKEIQELAKQINSNSLVWLIIVTVILVASITIAIIKKKKSTASKINDTEKTSESTIKDEPKLPDTDFSPDIEQNPSIVNLSAQINNNSNNEKDKEAKTLAEETTLKNNLLEQIDESKNLDEIIKEFVNDNNLETIINHTEDTQKELVYDESLEEITSNNEEIVEEIIEEYENEEETTSGVIEEIIDDEEEIEEIVEEVIEEYLEEDSGDEIVEEYLEDDGENKIVEEYLEESSDDEVVEEIIEEIVEEEEE